MDDVDNRGPTYTHPAYCRISLQPPLACFNQPKAFAIMKVYSYQLLVKQNC
jgi:hypothetical protein